MANTVYNNFVLSNEIEDQYNSHLDLQTFCTVDNSLEGTAGMLRKINVYKATDGTEKLAMGAGNSKSIEVGFTPREYRILLAQNRFKYYDEQAMTDPQLVPVGTKHMGTDMFNTVNADIYAEFAKATQVVVVTEFGFDAFADAQSVLALEDLEGVSIFAFVSPADVAELRKKLKDSLQYVEAYAKNGYIGTVAGVNIYTKKDAVSGSIYMATREAVTLFNKKGTEVEQERDPNTRENSIFSRKYYLAALTDETKDVKIFKGTAAPTEDTTVQEGTVYYKKAGAGYVAGAPETNPKTEGFYEIA
nr:MAG TPA: major capsid protein [Caudoviricetes sp.]